VADANDRLQEALAAYLEHREMGGSEPDTSYLTAAEQEQLRELIDALDLTEGIAFGPVQGSEEFAQTVGTTPKGERLLAELRGSLAPGVRIDPDENGLVSHVGGLAIRDRWIVGSFGGRIRVCLLEADTAQAIEANADCLSDLSRVFRMFPDMAAIALVGADLSCLIVEPEDCGPQIQVPAGEFVGRRYRRAIRPAAEAIADLLDELSPYWDPMPAFDRDAGLRIDFVDIGDDLVRIAIERQRGIGERARKGNPKKEALLALGKKEISALSSLAKGVFDGSVDPADVEGRIERWAEGR
jgi:hypothetical protein